MKIVHVSNISYIETLNFVFAGLPFPDNVAAAILHNIFIAGDQVSFDLTEKDLEVTRLYPDYNYTSVDDLLDLCLVNPPKVKLATFA